MSLRRKLLIPQLLIAAAITAYIYGVWMPENLAEAQRTRLLLIERHLQTVEEGLEPLLLSQQLDIIQENLTALIEKNPDWVSVQLFNAEGKRLYPTPASVIFRPQPIEEHRRTVERNIVLLGTLLGRLVVNLDIGPSLSQDRQESMQLLELILGLLSVMLAAVMLTLELAVHRPLKQLAEAATALSRQDFTAPLPGASKDEVGALASSFAAMRDNLGAFQIKLIHEIAERRQAEEILRQAEQKYREVFDNVSDSLLLFDVISLGEFRLAGMNPAAEKLCGVSKTKLIGDLFEGFAAAQDHQHSLELFRQCAETGKPVSYEQRCEFGANPRDLNTVLLPVRNEAGSIYRLIMFNNDITERKQAQDEALRLNAELEVRVAQRTALLEQANKELEHANKELEAFSYSVSHDLRTPLRAIDGYSRIMLEDYKEKVDEEGQRFLGLVVKNAERMSQLINDLLSFSRASRLSFQMETIDMGALVRDVFAELNEAVAARNIRLRIGDLPCVYGDKAMIRQVLRNLIGNAIKFTSRRPEAIIEVYGVVEGEKTVYTVKDNGAGFDMSFIDKLFGVFERLHSNEEFEGTGIGLAIVKRIIERHGGCVRAEGKVGEGAAFRFTLPGAPEGADCRPQIR